MKFCYQVATPDVIFSPNITAYQGPSELFPEAGDDGVNLFIGQLDEVILVHAVIILFHCPHVKPLINTQAPIILAGTDGYVGVVDSQPHA